MFFSKKASAIFSVSVALVLATAFAPDPDEDKNKLYVPDDLEATLWAETPMLHNPTNMDVDYKGRIWITEAVDYRNFNTKPGERINNEQKGDRVVILEDTDGDGKADKSKVFVQDKDLVAPLGIAVIGKKIIVSAAPKLIVFTDENGDDIPDKKEVLLTGFGGIDHDHSLHSVTAGPDGNWHFNTGNAGPHIVTDKGGWTLRSGSSYYGGTPYNKSNHGNQKSDDGRVWVGGLALRIDTEGKNLKVMGHNFRNSYEVGLDSYGNMWQNDNDDQVITCRVSYLMEGGNAGYFSADGTRFWQADRRPGQDMFTAHWHQDDPGVQPAIDNSGAGSPTGIAFYEGDALGEQYRGTLLSCEAGRNVIFSYQPTIKGGGFQMQRHNMISSFPKTDDHYIWHDESQDVRKWFRPSDVVAGTDGAIYIADWYDPVVGGHAMHDKKAYGRIFRITPKGKKLNPPVIDLTTVQGQVETLKNPAINVRNLGFEALRKGGNVSEVKKLLQDKNPYVRARAVWLLAKMGDDGIKEVEKVLDNEDVSLRITAFRALRQVKTDILPIADKLSTDKNTAVRREVGIALRDLPLASIKGIVNNLIKGYEGTDRFEIEAIGQALDGKESSYYQSIRPTLPKDPISWNEATASLIWRLHPVEAVNDLKLRASAKNLSEPQRKQAMTALAFIKDKRAVTAMLELTKNPLKEVADQAFWWINFRKTNDWADLMDWEKAANTQMSAQQKQMIALEKQMLDKNLILATRENAAEKMANDMIGGKMLLSLAGENRIPKEVRNVVAEHIFNNPDKSIRMMASDYFVRPSGKEISVNLALEMPSDRKKGYEVFRKNCATCHKFDKEGAEIGPELTLIGKKFDKAGLLDAIVNPSASMAFGYEPLIVTTKDKNTYYGFLVGDGATLTLKDVSGQLTAIKKANIASRKQLKNSLMPEPSSMGLKEKDLSDLAGYLLKLPLEE
ncbi:PVC-type heme-binding CxxCH protein [Emticicia sp. BO119]|uniref:PVC-type heme-binding CxxCH protein n=1 Tax=Emticicia sp. BO119 TaxID=2757768 RepID=UPI0015F09C6A|nr:PVC-type heme-binding CxxCH protein [Emticicia sp. BO119]MBA4849126.1 HEAT repeat domain-containing protein [Emticicia sp. BO119]